MRAFSGFPLFLHKDRIIGFKLHSNVAIEILQQGVKYVQS